MPFWQQFKAIYIARVSLLPLNRGIKRFYPFWKIVIAKIEPKQEGYLAHRSELTATEIDLADCPDFGAYFKRAGNVRKGYDAHSIMRRV